MEIGHSIVETFVLLEGDKHKHQQLTVAKFPLRLLIDELRRPQPHWDYRLSDQCAIGIARRLFPEISNIDTSKLGSFFGVDQNTLRSILTDPKTYGKKHLDRVTKENVADKLENLVISY